MTDKPSVLLVGQVLVDVTLSQQGKSTKLRLGGIFHAARALWAIGIPYTLAYAAPSYLDAAIQSYGRRHGAKACLKFGDVTGSPNVILINDVREVGEQGYDLLLRDEHDCGLRAQALRDGVRGVSDILILPGGFDLRRSVAALQKRGVRMYVDVANDSSSIGALGRLGKIWSGVFLSTSSDYFKSRFKGSAERYASYTFSNLAPLAILKENRGGARVFTSEGAFQIPAHLRRAVHSVGVGDCFDAVFVALRHRFSDEISARYASYVAGNYAATTFPDDFRVSARAALRIPVQEMAQIEGVALTWESRQTFDIYVAAPDFDYVDRGPLEQVINCLRYHNFRPRLPVRENGQAHSGMTPVERSNLFAADMSLLAKCKMLVAVLLYDDPGTLIEIGLAAERGIPVLVFDPYGRAANLMLKELPYLVSADVEEIVRAVYSLSVGVAS